MVGLWPFNLSIIFSGILYYVSTMRTPDRGTFLASDFGETILCARITMRLPNRPIS
ncbi:uncharacterized protein BO87DRAFT_107110 [Aspergillus neoniger CBS 115656]|uniref:Uncharacterized protein n=1 Tax=Aspergillus neoniger (strain CBS 115656) TaxID=1448310 RepID=A0A318YD76_ASPNB|nr:hypothetical protein BO87DRAFT_107110 [Aspergillus neoniger CBS 115656]PYH32336.1 hypothetical protein BO87DRAFT_107110 [Aspergillus neoniger CBS 115656]